MLDFDYSIPTKIFFGRNKIERLGEETKKYSSNILIVYGGGSIKRNGIFERAVKILNENKIKFCELSGIKPNPDIQKVREGIAICRKNGAGLVLAIGGGSAIDSAKAIAAGACHQGDPWEFFTGKSEIKAALPVATILTIAATGSEMNGNSVISDDIKQEKLATASEFLRPKFSILDPEYTFSVPEFQTGAGTVDIFAHVCEQYFSPTKGAYVQDRLAEAIYKTCIRYGRVAMDEPANYEARANLMWAGSLALNDLLSCGKYGDWSCHAIEHALSAMYEVTHGAGLAIIVPKWMEYVLDKNNAAKFAEYAKNVWDVRTIDEMSAAKEGIKKTAEFFKSLNMPSSLKSIKVSKKTMDLMAQKATFGGTIGGFKQLNKNDVYNILDSAF